MRAINATVMRQVNKRLILNHIRLRPISRAELAEETGLTRASVTQIVEELIGEGMVIETSVIGRTRLGRRSTQLAVNPKAGAIFAVNLGRSQCTVGVTDMHGNVLRQNTELVPGRTPGEILNAVADTIARQTAELGLDRQAIFGVGVSAPGPLNPETGALLNPVRFDMWHNLPLAQLLCQRTGLNVYLENTADAQALEQKYFAGAGESFALVRVEDSLSVGVVMRDSLYRGAPDFPLALGSCPVAGDGGSIDELIALSAKLEESGMRSWAELMRRSEEPAAAAMVDHLLKYLGYAVMNICYAYRVGNIVLGGEVGELLGPVVSRLEDAVKLHLAQRTPLSIRVAESSPVRMAAAPLYDTLFNG